MDLREAVERYKQFKIPSLSTICEKAKQHSKTCILIAIILFFVFIYLIQQVPHWQVAQFELSNATAVATLENQYRTTLAQILGGGAVVIGIYFAWGNLTTAREGQITERFTRAVEQLGSEKMEIRLGGIYALERISNESEKDYWPIMKILAAYIREKSPIKEESIEAKDTDKQNQAKTLSTDIQVILDVVCKYEKSYNESLDLQRTFLRGANLGGTHLEGANLKEANLVEANLEEANLVEARLEGANLIRANLERASLGGADFEGANFEDVNLTEANLAGANLAETFFCGANLKGANLEGANLEEAVLEFANFEKANLRNSNLKGANLAEGTNLKEANLEGAYLDWADLGKADHLSFDQLSKVKTLYHAKFDIDTDKELLTSLRKDYTALFENPYKNE